MAAANSSVLALDVGSKRVGVAVASLAARLPRPLTTLAADDPEFFNRLGQLVADEQAIALVVGYPRNLEGNATEQTAVTERFIEELKSHVALPIHLQDEALSSQRAESQLQGRGQAYGRGDIDALAASYILADWLQEHPEAADARL